MPGHWSEQTLQGFLKALDATSSDADVDPAVVRGEGTSRHCWRVQPCAFWHSDGEKEYQGHCGLYSSMCITAISDRRLPPRWMAKT